MSTFDFTDTEQLPNGAGGVTLAVEAQKSLLADIAKDVRRKVEEHISLTTPLRPQFYVVYSTAIPFEFYKAWQKAATKGDDINALDVATMALVSQCVAIRKHGEDTDESLEPVTFHSKALHEILEAGDPRHAVQQWYMRDAHAMQAAQVLLTKAGYLGSDVDEILPTMRE